MYCIAAWVLFTASVTPASYLKLPLRFEVNRGQSAPAARYLARGAGYTLYLTSSAAVLDLATAPYPLYLKLLGSNVNAAVEGLDALPGKSNYLRGNDPSKWIIDVPHYARVRYREAYPGIDLVYYGDAQNGGRLEYDFVVSPGADPKQIMMTFSDPKLGHLNGRIDDHSGDLLLSLGSSKVRNLRPVIYQMIDGRRHPISGGYRMSAEGVGFTIGPYDRSLDLVIDPVILYGQVLGTGGGSEGLGVAVDAAGNAYVTGYTTDTAFPTLNAEQGSLVAQKDAFVSKINAAGTGLVYSTFLGGSGTDVSNSIAVDAAGNAYIAGYTQSSDFPTHAPLQVSLTGVFNAFVAKLNPSGNALIYSTYLGGSKIDVANAIAIDASGNAYVAGYAVSTNFPTVSPYQAVNHGNANAFVSKLNAAGSALVYSTYLGGSGTDLARGIAVDASGAAYLAGSTSSIDFPLAGPVQAAYAGNDLFVTKLNPAGSALVYSTYYGGSGTDDANAIALDSSGNAYVAGFTTGPGTFPTVNPLPPPAGSQAGFLLKLNAAGSSVVYATTLDTNGRGVAVDAFGNAYVTGRGVDLGGSPVSMALRVNPSGVALDYSFQLGSALTNVAEAIAVDSSGNVYVSGQGSINTSLVPPASPSSASTFVSLAKVGDPPGSPHIGRLTPAATVVGSSPTQVQVMGSGFLSGATVRVNGSNRTTTFVSAAEVDATLPASDLTAATSIALSVSNPGGSPSNSATFSIVNPPPTISSLSPSSANAGDPSFTLTVNGSGFLAGSTVYWNGSARSTTVVNASKVTAQILSTDIAAGGTDTVQVNAPAPGGGLSTGFGFNITNPTPAITSLNPSSLDAGAASFALTVQGSGFTPSSVVSWNGSPRTTQFVSKNQLKATILASDMLVSGTAAVSVFTPTPGGGTASTSFSVTGNSVPVISTISPAAVTAGGAGFTLTVNGSGFIATSQVNWNASPRATTFAGATQLTMAASSADIANIGTAAVTVVTPAPGGGTSNSLSLAINGNPVPTVSSVSPTSVTAGSAGFTLSVTGTGFVQGSSIYWNGAPRAGSSITSTQISAQIAAQDIADGGTANIQVFVPPPGGGLSTPAVALTIDNPSPTIAALSPNTLPVSGPGFTLSVNGTGFTPSSKVRWNGTDRATTFTSPTQLSAAILASDLASSGAATVTVFNPTPAGGTSTGSTFTIAANPQPSISSISPSVLGAGSSDFTLTVNGAGFIAGSKVQWNAADRATTFVSATRLTAAITAGDVAGVGTATVTVVNASPGGGTSNSGTLTVTSGCVYFLTPLSTSFPVTAANGTVTVNAPSGCTWTASAVDSWLGITQSPAGSGSGTVGFSVAANSGAARTGSLTIAGQNVSISQAASIQGVVSLASANGAAGGTAEIPVNVVLNNGVSVDKIAFSLQIAPNAAAPALAGTLQFVAASTVGSPSTTDTSAGPGIISVGWLSLPSAVSGTLHLGDVVVALPAGAATGQTYGVQTTGATASLQSSDVPLSAGGSALVTIAADYLVGDVAPSSGSNVGQFGDGLINTIDLIAALRAATAVPGYVPPACSDLFDALDAFPADTATSRGGDGLINTLDLLAVLRKASGVDPTRFRRVVRTSCPAAAPENEIASQGKRVPVAPDAAIEIEDGAVYLRPFHDLDLAALAVSIASDDAAMLTWSAAADAPGVIDHALPGTLSLAWLAGLRLAAGSRLLLGRVGGGSLDAVHGASAHGRDGGSVVISIAAFRNAARRNVRK